jgi:1,4-dihydroxy-2-naphthoate octaprenyltransferase
MAYGCPFVHVMHSTFIMLLICTGSLLVLFAHMNYNFFFFLVGEGGDLEICAGCLPTYCNIPLSRLGLAVLIDNSFTCMQKELHKNGHVM